MNKGIISLLVIIAPLFSSAQKKSFTFRQLFGGEFPQIFKPIPEIQGWIDEDHYIEIRRNSEGAQTAMAVDARSGKAVPYTGDKNKQPEPPSVSDAQNITLSPDKKYAAYTRNNNLYVMDIASKKETPVTNDGSSVILNGYASWIYYEEILGRSSEYKAFWWSPDSRHLAFMRFDDTEVPVFPIYFADGQHGFLEEQRYPKAGDKNPQVKIGITPVEKPAITWADFNPAYDQYFGTPYWANNNELLVQWMNREQDSLIIYHVNKIDGGKKPIYTETQPTWITLDDENRFYFLSGNNGFLLRSDKDGWQNLYHYDMNGKLINKVTTGNFWGTSVLTVDEKNKQVFLKARKDHSARFDVYRVSLNGKNLTRLTRGNFSYDAVEMSPGGKHFITTYSNLSELPATSLIDRNGKLIRELGNSKGDQFGEYALPVTTMVTVKSSDGLYDLPMTITYPVGFDSTKKYPVWISVYGGPNSGTVYDRWKPTGGFTQWMAQEGVIQVAMDNRSSGHFGKKGIDFIYKQMGKWEIEDYMTCTRWLKSRPWVNTAKVAINGGSFGGYITCMALTYGADVFNYGIASYSVTDWQLYDTHYTERFMNKPQDNEEGYKNTSVLSYIDRYKGGLRIVHGTTDDNVHMQNSIQLINALQDRNRNFELMLYPNQRHGISGRKAAHNFVETCRFIYRNLLDKELPADFNF